MSNTTTSIDLIQARLTQALPDEVHAISVVCEGARRWAASADRIKEIRTILVHPGRDWEQFLDPTDRQAFAAMFDRAVKRCGDGAEAVNWRGTSHADDTESGPFPAVEEENWK